MEHILYSQIIDHLNKNNILKDYQHAFRSKRSCESQLIITIDGIARALDNRAQVDLLIMDFSKAFDTVPHARLSKKLEHCGINGSVLGWINYWLTNRQQRVIMDGMCSLPVKVRSGIPQGTVLGPLMFLVYINDIGDDITSNLRLFADDTLMYLVIEKPEDCTILQDDLDKLSMWASKWQMAFNISKCKSMTVTRKKNPLKRNYIMQGKPLEQVDSHPYLGIEVESSLNWRQHVLNITAKANRTLGFVKRNMKRCPPQVKEQAYKTLVRPKLEYASTVWSPYQKYQIHYLEAVQRKAARFCTGCWDREPGTVTGLLERLNWKTLQSRREKSRLAILYKITHKLIAIPLPEHIKPLHYSVTRQYHPRRFYELVCSTKAYQNSFFPGTISLWNRLSPSTIEASSLKRFKQLIDF